MNHLIAITYDSYIQEIKKYPNSRYGGGLIGSTVIQELRRFLAMWAKGRQQW